MTPILSLCLCALFLCANVSRAQTLTDQPLPAATAIPSNSSCGTAGSWTYISSQAQLSSLSQCTSILGSLQIQQVTDLSPLAKLTSVQLSFEITQSDVFDLTGLSSLTSVGENVFIHSNSKLNTLNGLQSLQNVTGGVFIYDLPSLTSIAALVGLKYINAASSPKYNFGLSIYRNPLLRSLEGLQNLQSVGQTLQIDNCPLLKNLEPIASASLSPIQAPLNISIISMSALTDISALKRFVSRSNVPTGLHIIRAGNLTTLKGVENLANIGNLTISSNALLYDVKDLASPNTTIAGPYVTIEDNGQLCDMAGLNVTIPARVPTARILYACGTGTGGSKNTGSTGNLPNSATSSKAFSGLLILSMSLIFIITA